jgi:hypothetical protein
VLAGGDPRWPYAPRDFVTATLDVRLPVARAVVDGEGDGDGLGPVDPTVGEGWALRVGLGLGDAAPGEWLALGRLVRVGAGLLCRACGW